MKSIFKALRNLHKKPTVADVLDTFTVDEMIERIRKEKSEKSFMHVAGRTFQVLWCVCDYDTCKVIKDGFETELACDEYMSKLEYKGIMCLRFPYEVEVTK